MKVIWGLLPGGFRPVGLLLTITGVIVAILRFYFGIKPEGLNRQIFAFYSYYLDSRIFALIRNQLLEEIAGILIILGLFCMAVTREKKESLRTQVLRGRAVIITAYFCTAFLIAALLFTYGFGFVFMMILYLGLWQLSYIITFRILLRMNPEEYDITE